MACMQDLRQQGYNVGDIPEKEEDLIKSVLNDPEVPYIAHNLRCALPIMSRPSSRPALLTSRSARR